MIGGYIKSYRTIWDKPRSKDPEYISLWMWMLHRAAFKETEVTFKGETIKLKPGQFTAGRRQASEATGVCQSKVTRLFRIFQKEGQIEQQASNKCTLFTIANWELYQGIEQQPNNNRTTTEQQPNTKEERKEGKKVKNNKNALSGEDLEAFEKYWEKIRPMMITSRRDKAASKLKWNNCLKEKIKPEDIYQWYREKYEGVEPQFVGAFHSHCKADSIIDWRESRGSEQKTKNDEETAMQDFLSKKYGNIEGAV